MCSSLGDTYRLEYSHRCLAIILPHRPCVNIAKGYAGAHDAWPVGPVPRLQLKASWLQRFVDSMHDWSFSMSEPNRDIPDSEMLVSN